MIYESQIILSFTKYFFIFIFHVLKKLMIILSLLCFSESHKSAAINYLSMYIAQLITRGLCFCGVIRRIASVNSPFDDKLVGLKKILNQNTHERKNPKHI